MCVVTASLVASATANSVRIKLTAVQESIIESRGFANQSNILNFILDTKISFVILKVALTVSVK